MRPATIQGNLSTGMFWRVYPLDRDVWLLCACGVGRGRDGEPTPNPDRRWLANFVHGESYQPDGYDAPGFKQHHSPENEARVVRWRNKFMDAVSRFGVVEEPSRRCWSVRESNVDRLLDYLEQRAADDEFNRAEDHRRD
jgi:hypothetical protein